MINKTTEEIKRIKEMTLAEKLEIATKAYKDWKFKPYDSFTGIGLKIGDPVIGSGSMKLPQTAKKDLMTEGNELYIIDAPTIKPTENGKRLVKGDLVKVTEVGIIEDTIELLDKAGLYNAVFCLVGLNEVLLYKNTEHSERLNVTEANDAAAYKGSSNIKNIER